MGTLFVHRNVGNVCVHSDSSLATVLEFAVKALKVPHIVICGHTNCGAVKASLSDVSSGSPVVDQWVRHIKDVWQRNREQVELLEGDERERKVVEMNVADGVKKIVESPTVQQAWWEAQHLGKPKAPQVHGMVYDVGTGELRQVDVDLSDVTQLKF